LEKWRDLTKALDGKKSGEEMKREQKREADRDLQGGRCRLRTDRSKKQNDDIKKQNEEKMKTLGR